jgi:hypothetical protein
VIPPYTIPDQDVDLWSCGVRIDPHDVERFPPRAPIHLCAVCRKAFSPFGTKGKLYCGRPCQQKASRARRQARELERRALARRAEWRRQLFAQLASLPPDVRALVNEADEAACESQSSKRGK